MRKTLSIVAALVFCFCVTAACADDGQAGAKSKEPVAASAGNAPASAAKAPATTGSDKAPVTAVIDAAAKKQPPVMFPHEKHTKLGKPCETCHHTNKGLTADTKTKVEKCSKCHMEAKGKVTTMSDVNLLKNPMHARCVGCHKELKKGPVACTKCHVKK